MTRSASNARTVSTTHTVFVAAPPRAVYELIADVGRWPYIFEPTVHAERLEAGASEERLRQWAVANGAVRSWTSRRVLDPHGLRIRFRQENPAPPVAAMAGEWVLVPLPGNATSVVLLHDFRAVGDDPVSAALIKQAVDRNSTAELAAIKSTAELGEQLPNLVHSFADTVLVDGELGPVYDFLYRAQEWPSHLPHVSRLTLDEAVPNVQTVEMETVGADGNGPTVRLVRICFPYDAIVYKQTQPPEQLAAHVGAWYLYPTASGVRVTAHNTVMLRPDRLLEPRQGTGSTGLAGSNGRHELDAAVEHTADHVRQLLRRNCIATLVQAKKIVEARSELPVPRTAGHGPPVAPVPPGPPAPSPAELSAIVHRGLATW